MTQTKSRRAVPDNLEQLKAEIALLNQRLDAVVTRGHVSSAAVNPEEEPEDTEAFQRLADAFATIEELNHYLAGDFYNQIANAICDCLTDTQWQSKPTLIRQVFPFMLRENIAMEDARTKERRERADRIRAGLERVLNENPA